MLEQLRQGTAAEKRGLGPHAHVASGDGQNELFVVRREVAEVLAFESVGQVDRTGLARKHVGGSNLIDATRASPDQQWCFEVARSDEQRCGRL